MNQLIPLTLISLIIILAFIGWLYEMKETQKEHQRNIETTQIQILKDEQTYRHNIGQPFHPKQLK